MKFVKGIGLFFIYPACLLGLGFYAGVRTTHFFYPGDQAKQIQMIPQSRDFSVVDETPADLLSAVESDKESGGSLTPVIPAEEGARTVATSSETLCVETEYVLEETDVTNHTVVETTWRLPDKYIGMNREQFLTAMENYEAAPPLSEQERGFIGLEVVSFSRERVVVQMNYQYVQPGNSYYLVVYDNEVVVYLEDLETVYIETDIRLDTLPETVQNDIIQMMWVEDEAALYNFLETYSS